MSAGTGTEQPARPTGRRRRRTSGRQHAVTVRLDDSELELLARAAEVDGSALAAYISLTALGVARGQLAPIPSTTAELLRELSDARRQVQRFGVLVNQAVAKLNTTGQAPPALGEAMGICTRAVLRLDEAVVRVRPPRS